MSREPREDFDAVETMREIRDRLSDRIKSMPTEEQRESLEAEVSSDAKLKRLMERAAQQEPAAEALRRWAYDEVP